MPPAEARTRTTVAGSRVTACGTALCVQGVPWAWHAGSVYATADPEQAISQARALGLNAVRLTDFLDVSAADPAGAYDEERWRRVDATVAAAARAGLRVELDLSTFRNLLWAAGRNPYTVDWTPFLTFVAHRTNTVSGLSYASDPTIAIVAFAGEVEPISTPSNTRGVTTAGLTAFFGRVFTTWGALAPGVLRTSGGLLQLDWDSGIDWRAISSLPGSDISTVHAYSDADLVTTMPVVAAAAIAANRPWVLEEFGFPVETGDRARAARFRDVFRRAARLQAAGWGFWNVGPQTHDSFDVGPQTPLTAAMVRRYADSEPVSSPSRAASARGRPAGH